MSEPTLLAVDLGLRCGFARFGPDGRLRGYRSTNFGKVTRLRRAVPGVLAEIPDLAAVVVEGDRALGDLWERGAKRRSARFLHVAPETWRAALLSGRVRSSLPLKEAADALARRVITWSGAPRPTSLRHDAAEAILIGLWGALELGWLTLTDLGGV